MVSVPNDLRKNKEKVIGNMDLRETICTFLACILAVGILYYFRIFLGIKSLVIIAFFASLVTIPFLIYGFKRVNGMRIDDYLKIHFNNKVMATDIRLNRYDVIEPYVKNKKYELLRIYKLDKKIDIFILRDYLLERKELILTEYIEYDNEVFAIFRLDGTKIIKDKVNKENKIWTNKRNLAIKTKFNNLTIKIKKLLRFKNIGELDLINNKFIHKKTFLECKNETDIFEHFENIDNIKLERADENIVNIIKTKNKKRDNKKTKINKKGTIVQNIDKALVEEKVENKNIFEKVRCDARTVYLLHIFNKENIVDFLKENVKNKFIFINNEGRVNLFFYGDNSLKEKALLNMIDLKVLDKNTFMYENLVSSKCINSYNLYRNIENIECIL